MINISMIKNYLLMGLFSLTLCGCVNDAEILVKQHQAFDQENAKSYQFHQNKAAVNQPTSYEICGDAAHPCVKPPIKIKNYWCYQDSEASFYSDVGHKPMSSIQSLTCKKERS